MKVGELIAVLSVDMSQYDKDLATAKSKAETIVSSLEKPAKALFYAW
ncbi:hypothetical protein [Carboxydothermus hydrogenoformans]|uniref:Uncharacterized protein n=1 Tax=Carboxydothermus hydrogenoformans (strain ATCC BAA-161 / DSM 6008 / Z-2901) TaxID=246194 RepID=Q3ADU1_CARHZ|nr:hypothetical protein [Carboxydothermus hydrogenoformans]ABB13907.1 hypothetical protein CHY_0841 [Carboxydothermus hydrogenoformans Z-2901]